MEQKKSTSTLPDGWIWTTIGDILILEYGKALPHQLRLQNGKYPVYGSNGKVGFHNDFLVDGPVIILGRKGSVGALHLENNKCWPIDTTYFIISSKSLNQKYIYYLLKSLRLEKLDSSTAIPGINRNHVYDIKIPLPPLEEQQRIVARIEELFSELDHAEEVLKKAQKQIEVYKYALLKSAFEGKLTEKWREENSSQKWRIAKIGDYSLFIGSGSTPKGGKSIYSTIGIPFIRSLNVRTNHFSWEDIVYISKHIHDTMSRTHTKPKDVLLNITGASIGRCAYIPEILKEGNVNQHVCIIRLNEKEVNYKYLTFYLNSPEAQIIIKRINSGATREALTLDQIKNFSFPLCTVNEQNLIVQGLEAKYSLIENLESSIILGLEKIEKSLLSILKESFEGKLVPQNSNEESAQALIKKIQIEKNNYSLNSAKNNVAKSKTMKNKPLIDILDENFVDQEFTFDDIKNKTFISYDELKDQLYHLLDKLELEMIYSQEFQRIKFKLRS